MAGLIQRATPRTIGGTPHVAARRCTAQRAGWIACALLMPMPALGADAAVGQSGGGLLLGLLLTFGVMLVGVIAFLRVARRRIRHKPSLGTVHPLEILLQRAVLQAASQLRSDENLAVLQADLARTLASWPGAAFCAVVTSAEYSGRMDCSADEMKPNCLVFRTGQKKPKWFTLPNGGRSLMALLGGQYHEVVYRPGLSLPGKCGIPAAMIGPYDAALLAPVALEPNRPLMLLLVGVQTAAVNREQFEPVLQRLSGWLALLLDARRLSVALRCELEALQAKNITLRRLNRMQNEFLAVASHELKTPLTSIGAYTEVLHKNAAQFEFPQAEEFLSIIKEESDRLLRLVNRILDFSQLEFGQRALHTQVCPLSPLITETVRTLAPLVSQKGLQLEIDCPPALPMVEADADLIRQVLINLVNNAIKFTPRAGMITIRAVEDAATIRVSVIDTGPGIPAQELQRIFGQFYRLGGPTADEEGAGLGLAIVKNIVNLHQGHVDVQSQEGRGATFSFHLPKQHYIDSAPVFLLGEKLKEPPLEQVLRLSIRMVAEMMEARSTALMLLDPNASDLVVNAALGIPSERVESLNGGHEKSLARRAMKEGVTVHSEHAMSADAFSADATAAAGWEFQVAGPIRIEERIAGAVVVGRKMNPEPFDQDDLNLLATLCDVISAALTTALRHADSGTMLLGVVEALQTLAMLKRSAVPTATPLALRLLASTARRLGLSRAEVKRLQYVASLHDAGMVKIGEDIALKPGVLTEEERDEIGRHPEWGAHLMAPLLPLPEMGRIILAHHERMDGTGYPDGLQGGDIPLGSRILAVVDAFFAMIVNRPYRPGRPAEIVAEELQLRAGSQFDPDVVREFLNVLQEEGMLSAAATFGAAGTTRSPTSGSEETRWQPQGS